MERIPKSPLQWTLKVLVFGLCILLVLGKPLPASADDEPIDPPFDLFSEIDGEEIPLQDYHDDQTLQVKENFDADFSRRLKSVAESEQTDILRAQVFHQVYTDYTSQTRLMPAGKIRKAFSKALGSIANDLVEQNVWPDGHLGDRSPTRTLEVLRLVAKVPGQNTLATDLIRKNIPPIYSQVDPQAAFTLSRHAHRNLSEWEQEKALRSLLRAEPSNTYSLAEYIISLEKKKPDFHRQLIGLIRKMSEAPPFSSDSSFRQWAGPDFFAAISSGCEADCLFEQLNVSGRGFHLHFRNAVNTVPNAIRSGRLGLAVRMIRNLSDVAYKNRHDPFYAEHFAQLTDLNAKLPPELRLNLVQDSIDKRATKLYRDTPELQKTAKQAVTIQGTIARALGEPGCHEFYRKLAYTPQVYARNRKALLVGGGLFATAAGVGIGIHSLVSDRKDAPPQREQSPSATPESVVPQAFIPPTPSVEADPVSKRWKEFLEKLSFSPALPEYRIRQQILDGKRPDFDLVTQTIWDKYLTEHQKQSERALQKTELSMLRKVILRDVPPSADAITFKLSLENKLRTIHPNGLIYNQLYTNPVSTLIDGKDQCSATSLCRDLLLRQYLGQKAYDAMRPVYIIEKGHVLNGFVTESGELLGLEGTVEGSGLKKYGKISELKDKPFAIRVIDAEDYLLADLYAKDLSPQAQERLREIILQGSALKFKLPLQEMERHVAEVLPATSALGSHSPLNQSLFSFGSPDPIEGDANRSKAEEVPPEKPGMQIASPKQNTPPLQNGEVMPPPPALPEFGADIVNEENSKETAPPPKFLPGAVVPLSDLGQRLAEDLNQIYVDSKWNSDRVLARYGSAALSYLEPLSPESEEAVRFKGSDKVFYEWQLQAENAYFRVEGFEKLCRIVGDPVFSEADRVSALTQLMSLDKKKTEQVLRRVQQRLPKLYDLAADRAKK